MIPLVGIQTAAAVLIAVVQITEDASASLPQGVKRTVAEQTVEIVWIGRGVTGEIFAFFM